MRKRINKERVRKIVLVVPSIGMGEVVFISMVVGVIRDNMPRATITFVSGEYSCAFLRFIPGVSECVALETLGFSPGREAGEGLMGKLRYMLLLPRFILFFRRRGFDLAFVSGRGRLFTSWLFLVLRLAGTAEVVLLAPVLQRHLDAKTHVVDSYKAILREMGLAVKDGAAPALSMPEGAMEEARRFLEDRGMDPAGTRFIGICPQSTRAIKNWAPEKFIALMERLAVDPQVRFLVFAHGDEEWARAFSEGAGARALVLGSLPMEMLMGLVRHCGLFISVDTGPMHIAAAFGVPTIGLFGPTSAAMYGPYGEGNVAISADVSGCRYYDPTFMGGASVQLCYREDRCLVESDSCINRISVDDVAEAARKLLPAVAVPQ